MKALRHSDGSLSLRRGVYTEVAWLLLQGTRPLTGLVSLSLWVSPGYATDSCVAFVGAAASTQVRVRSEGVSNEWRLSTTGGAAYMQHVFSHPRLRRLQDSETLENRVILIKGPLKQRCGRPLTEHIDNRKTRAPSASSLRAALTAMLMFTSLELGARTYGWPVGGSRIVRLAGRPFHRRPRVVSDSPIEDTAVVTRR